MVTKSEEEVLEAIKRLAVIKVATCVRRTNLLHSKQASGESIREFYANVKAAAAICNYKVKCTQACCAGRPLVDYTSAIVKDVLVAGIADSDLRREVLSWNELDDKDAKDVVTFIESKEVAIKAWSGSSNSALSNSSYKKQVKGSLQNESIDSSMKTKLSLKGSCEKCRLEINVYKRYQNGKLNRKPFRLCGKCYKEDNQNSGAVSANNTLSQFEPELPSNVIDEVSGFFIGGLDNVESLPESPSDVCPLIMDHPLHPKLTKPVTSSANVLTLDHHIFFDNQWRQASAPSHPTLRLRLSTSSEDYDKFDLKHPQVQPKYIDAIVDSGAQSCLWSRKRFLRCGFSMIDLIPVRHSMKAANKASINIDGAIILCLSGSDGSGNIHEAQF